MPGLMPGIHVFKQCSKKDVDGRDVRAFTPVFDGLCPAMTTEKSRPRNGYRLRQMSAALRATGTLAAAARYIGMPHIDREKQRAAADREFVRAQQKADAPVAMAEYRAAQEALRARTRILREQRLAREAAAGEKIVRQIARQAVTKTRESRRPR